MMRRPPQHALLRASLGEKGDNKLRKAIEPECAMAEVTMIACGDREHSNAIREGQPRKVRPLERCPQQKQARSMQRGKGNNGVEMKSSNSSHIQARLATACPHTIKREP